MAVTSTPATPARGRRRPRKRARRGPVGARPPRAAEPQRADQEGRRPAQRPGPDREHLRPPRLRLASTRPTCAAGSAGGASTPSARPGIDGGRTAVLEPHELDDEYFMLRVRIDGGQLDLAQLRDDRRDLHASSAATPPTSPTGRTSSCTGSGSRTCRRSGAGSRRSACQTTEACGDMPAGRAGQPGRRGRRRRGDRPDPGDRRDRRAVRRRPGVLQPAAQVQVVDLLAGRHAVRGQRHRVPRRRCTPSTGPASTCGSAAACPPTRCWPSGSASGCRWTRCPTSGPAWSASSATTATAGCATGPG